MKIKYTFQGETREAIVHKNQAIVGRSNPLMVADIDLFDDDAVSRTHARIWWQSRALWVEDLASKQGTFVNGVRLQSRHQLKDTDVIQIGTAEIHASIEESDFVTRTALTPKPDQSTATPKPIPGSAPAGSPLGGESDVNVESELKAEDASFLDVAGQSRLDAQRLALILRLPLLFAEKKDLKELLQCIVESVLDVVPGAERGALMLLNSASNQLEVKAWAPDGDVPVSVTLAARALDESRAFVWRNTLEQEPTASMKRLEIKTGMYSPMFWKGRRLGVLCVDNPRRETLFNEADLQLLLAVASYAAMAVIGHRMEP